MPLLICFIALKKEKGLKFPGLCGGFSRTRFIFAEISNIYVYMKWASLLFPFFFFFIWVLEVSLLLLCLYYQCIWELGQTDFVVLVDNSHKF